VIFRRARRDVWLLLLLAALPAVAYAPAWTAHRLLGSGDGAALHFPLRALVWESYARGELPEWRQRLGQILMIDIRQLRTPFKETLYDIRDRYENLPPEHYANVAHRYGARYILVGHRLGDDWEPRRVREMNDATDAYFLYDLRR